MAAFKFECSMIRGPGGLFLGKVNLEDERWDPDYDPVPLIDSTGHGTTG
jgi:hypothetical protein